MIQDRDLGDENDEIFLDLERTATKIAELLYCMEFFDKWLKKIHDEYKKCVNTQNNTESAYHQHCDRTSDHPI